MYEQPVCIFIKVCFSLIDNKKSWIFIHSHQCVFNKVASVYVQFNKNNSAEHSRFKSDKDWTRAQTLFSTIKNTYKFGPTPIYHHDHYYYCYFANTIVIKSETYFKSLDMENSILNFFSKSHCYLKINFFNRALKYLRNYFFLSFFFSSVQGVPY